MRTAIVHDWLYVVGGAERVLQGMLRCYPDADVYCLFDNLSERDRQRIGFAQSTTSFLQRMPGVRRNHRRYLPLMPIAVEQFDLRGYDLVLSSSYAVAKGILTGPDQLHISYVHSPMRYAWDLQQQYLDSSGLTRGVRTVLARALLHWMRIWDVRTAHGVDEYIANSQFVAGRIRKLYGRRATVIHPPVRVPSTPPSATRERFFLTASRLVPYKNTRNIVEAFNRLPDLPLFVAGDGPELNSLKEIAGQNVAFLGHVEDEVLAQLMDAARAFVFAAEEDFGIVSVEAQGRGCPVIALGRGGSLETVVGHGRAQTGLFFDAPDASSIGGAITRFLETEADFSPMRCWRHAQRFAERRFDAEFRDFVEEKLAGFDGGRPRLPPEREDAEPRPPEFVAL